MFTVNFYPALKLCKSGSNSVDFKKTTSFSWLSVQENDELPNWWYWKIYHLAILTNVAQHEQCMQVYFAPRPRPKTLILQRYLQYIEVNVASIIIWRYDNVRVSDWPTEFTIYSMPSNDKNINIRRDDTNCIGVYFSIYPNEL